MLKAQSPKKHHILELGSATAMYIRSDADIELAVNAAAKSAFGFAGQVCLSLQRLYVHEDVVDVVVAGLVLRARAPTDASRTSFHTQVSSIFEHPFKRDLFIALGDRWLPRYTADSSQALAA